MVFEKSLTAMVKGIRAHRGKETEYINACIQEIQKEVQSTNLSTKSMAVLKLCYLTMLGYDMAWSAFAVVEVMSHNKFAVKRQGYLASSISFTDSTSVGLLTINLFKKDFGSKSQFESGMAIACLSSICTPEISKDIVTDLLAMLSSSRAYLRKKTVLCLYRIFVKDPPALRTCFPKLKERLSDEDQGVLTATVNTFLELARKNSRNYLSLVPQLYHILVNTTNNWLTIKLLKVFQLLCPLEPRLPAKLVEPLTNLLSTTKAQSVEFEAIRTVVRIMPEGAATTSLAIERLQTFLNSSDRNLRFLGLELFKEVLEKPNFKEKYTVPELHEKVLQSVEESDVTARSIALQLLDRIVSPASFVDTVKKLMEFSKSTGRPDEFIGTVLRMAARDTYMLVEDFAWYLFVLADIARNGAADGTHAEQVANQFTDIAARVAQVRPIAVNLALSLLDRSPQTSSEGQELSLDVVETMIGACAWVLGEYVEDLEAPKDASLMKAARALVAAKHIRAMPPCIQTQCVWAATKLYISSPKIAPSAVQELHELLTTNLPTFVRSTHVEVSERATLSLHLTKFFKADPDKILTGSSLCQESLLPVKIGAQKAIPEPENLGLDEPFFAEPEAPQDNFVPVRADPTDPYALAATYKDDLGFLAAQEASARQAPAKPDAAPLAQQHTSMFYIGAAKDPAAGGGDGSAGNDGAIEGGQAQASASKSAPVPVDPLEQMRERLAAQRASGGGAKYQVLRDDIGAPGAAPAAAPAPEVGAGTASSAPLLPVPPEKELSELQGRMWSVCYRDAHIGVYACVRSKSAKKQLLRVDLRCERVSADAGTVLSDVFLKLPAGVSAQEAGPDGLVRIATGELAERSPKVKANIGLAPFVAPVACALPCEIHYSLASQPVAQPLSLALPATAFLTPAVTTTEDEIASYMQREQLQMAKQEVSLSAASKTAEVLYTELPLLVGRCAALCYLHGIQQPDASPSKGQKFILMARPPSPPPSVAGLDGQQPMQEGALVVCKCACRALEGSVALTVIVKAARKDVSDDVCSQLISTFRELIEGRLCL